MKRSPFAFATLAALALTGCRDLGLDGNIPLAEAEHKPLLPLPAKVHPARQSGHAGVLLAGTRWIDAGLPVEVPARTMGVVGEGHGHPLYALRWDDAPYDRIYALMGDGRWQPHDPVRGVDARYHEAAAIEH